MPQDNFGRILPPPEQFNALPAAMKAECLALMAERALEDGKYRRADLIESRMHLYAGEKPYKLPDAAMAPAPRWIGRETVWHMTAYSGEEVARINKIAGAIVAGYWPHCSAHSVRPRTVRMLAYIAETLPDRTAHIFPYDLSLAFGVAEEVLCSGFAEAARNGFLAKCDDFAWIVTNPPVAAAAKLERAA